MFEGDRALVSKLAKLTYGLSDLTLPTQKALDALGKGVIQTFIEGPGSWEDLKDGSVARLYESGDMFVAAAAAEPGIEGSVYDIAPDGLEGQIGVEDLFHGARRHQLGYGGPDSRGRSFDEPARSFMVITNEARAEGIEIFEVHIGELMAPGK